MRPRLNGILRNEWRGANRHRFGGTHISYLWFCGNRRQKHLGPAEAGPRGTSHGVGCRQEGLPMAAPLRALNESSMVSMSLALALSRMFLYRWLWLKRSWR